MWWWSALWTDMCGTDRSHLGVLEPMALAKGHLRANYICLWPWLQSSSLALAYSCLWNASSGTAACSCDLTGPELVTGSCQTLSFWNASMYSLNYVLPYSQELGAHLFMNHWAWGLIYHCMCDTWPLQCQTFAAEDCHRCVWWQMQWGVFMLSTLFTITTPRGPCVIFPFSALTLSVRRQEGHPAYKKLGNLLMMTICREFCMS